MKQLKKINLFLALLFSVITIILSWIYCDITILLYLIIIPIAYILKLKPVLIFIYLIYTFIAFLLGSLCHLYQITTWYDTFAHFLWGVISGLIAIYILDKFNLYDKNKIWFNVFFIFIFSLATFTIWEVGEFSSDKLFGMDTQRASTGVYDTMKDIIAALIGNILFLSWYSYEYLDKHNGLIKIFVKNMNKN